MRKATLQVIDQLSDPINRLGGLADHTEQRAGFEGIDLRFVQNDVASGMIFGEAADLDVVGLADDDGVTTLLDEGVEGSMGAVDERAGGFGDLKTHGFEGGNTAAGSAMGGDQDPLGGDI